MFLLALLSLIDPRRHH
jgi:hypothetical protein